MKRARTHRPSAAPLAARRKLRQAHRQAQLLCETIRELPSTMTDLQYVRLRVLAQNLSRGLKALLQ